MAAMLELVGSYGALALRWAWQATLVSGLVLIIVALLRQARPVVRHALLLIALLKFALPPIILLPYGPILPEALLGPPHSGLELAVQETGSGAARPLLWPGVLAAAYLLGVSAAATLLAARVMRLWFLRRRSRSLGGPLLEATRRLAIRLGIQKPPDLLVSEETTMPFLTGLVAPAVILPRSLIEDMDAPEVERIVAHELAHLRHGDLWFNGLRAALGVVWWWHPLFWIVSAKSRQIAEERSDERVVGDLAIPVALYARMLVRAAAVCVAPKPPAIVVGLFGRRHPLEHRLSRLSQGRSKDRRLTSAGGLAAALLVGLFAVLGSSAAKTPNEPLSVIFVHDHQHSDHRAQHAWQHL